MTIHLDPNSDAVGEIDLLRDLLHGNTGYTYKRFTNKEIVAIALDELYDKLVAEKKSGINQRNI